MPQLLPSFQVKPMAASLASPRMAPEHTVHGIGNPLSHTPVARLTADGTFDEARDTRCSNNLVRRSPGRILLHLLCHHGTHYSYPLWNC